MADNVTLPGTGTVAAADEIGGVHYQRVKPAWGADGVAIDVSESDPMPVDVQNLPALLTRVPDNEASALPIRQVGQEIWNVSFSDVGASFLSSDFVAPVVGPGVGYSQAGGALLITTGATARSEFLTRSTRNWRGSMRLRYSTVLSQRISNQNFLVILADLIGEGLAYTNTGTTVDVTLPAHGFTAANIGQSMFLGGCVITTGTVNPGRWPIASIPDANTIRFTVSTWSASGSGTLTLFGHSHAKALYTGTTATNVAVAGQRKGWAAADNTLTINTTASPGHIAAFELTGREGWYLDKLRATSTGPTMASRGSLDENLPDDNLDLYVFLWYYAPVVAPASTTTWTISYVSVEKFANTPVYIQGVRANGSINPLPVSGGVTVSGTVTANIGTGAIAAGTNAIGDVGVQYRANATGASSFVAVMSPATPAAAVCKASAGRLLGMELMNTAAAIRSVKFWNTAVGSVVLGTTAAVFEIDIPAGARVSFNLPGGVGFATAITYAVTGAKGLTDNTGGLALNDVTGLLMFA